MEVSGQHHTPAAFSLGKTPVLIEKEADWAPELVRIIHRKEKF